MKKAIVLILTVLFFSSVLTFAEEKPFTITYLPSEEGYSVSFNLDGFLYCGDVYNTSQTYKVNNILSPTRFCTKNTCYSLENISSENNVYTYKLTKCEHIFSEETTPAKYFSQGVKVKTCNFCGYSEKESIPKLSAKSKWITEDGKTYYFNSKGNLTTGWNKLTKDGSTKWYYFSSNGVLLKTISANTKKKWVSVDNKKFYFTNKKTLISSGFHVIGNNVYKFQKDHSVFTGKFKMDGMTFTTRANGSLKGLPYYKYRYKTFIFIDISEQQLYYYKNKSLKLKGDVVTGKNNATPTGTFKVRSKSRNIYLTGPTWKAYVQYWMAFIGNAYGMHDASWRSSAEFSNHKTYIKNGSHGCVNMRKKDAAKLYSMVKVGTKVFIED